MTLDELIKKLEKKREQIGGSAEVTLRDDYCESEIRGLGTRTKQGEKRVVIEFWYDNY